MQSNKKLYLCVIFYFPYAYIVFEGTFNILILIKNHNLNNKEKTFGVFLIYVPFSFVIRL